MNFKISWEFVKNDNARLHFGEKIEIDEDTRVEIVKELAEAGIDNGSMLPPTFISFVNGTVHMTKWQHYKWTEVCPIVEEVVNKYFPGATFENSKTEKAPK